MRFVVIVNCGPCEAYIERSLRSIITQSHTDWTAQVSVDPCGDGTFARATTMALEDSRLSVTGNDRKCFAMENLVKAVARSGARPEDVCVVLDGDDWFQRDDALEVIARTYSDTGAWLTYGSWVSDDPRMPGLWPSYPEGTTNFRQVRWQATAVRSWKKWLWDRIDTRDFRDDDGKYFRVGEDLAAMLPMLEMAGTARARHIAEPLMWYNRANPASAASTWPEDTRRVARIIRARTSYAPLPVDPD